MPDLKKKCGVLYREGEVVTREDGTRSVDSEKRTVEIAFSSETPVERWFGSEILDHDPKSVRLGRLQNKGPVLVDHRRSDHVGVVDSVSIDADRRGRATVRFGKGERASEIFNDVNDGIRVHVSVGYRVHEWVENKDGDTRVTDWEPMELSFVSIPADDSVGVGRDADLEENEVTVHSYQTREGIMPDPVKEPTPSVDVKKIEREAAENARKAEQARIREINALGQRNDVGDLADTAVAKGTSLDDFRIELIDAMEARREKEAKERMESAKPATLLDMGKEDVQRYSLMKAIRAVASGNWKGAEFERECSLEVEKSLDREARGFFVPYDVQMGERAGLMGATSPTYDGLGAELVGTDHLAGSFIDYLYTRSVLFGAGATALPGLVGNVDIPKQAGSTTFYWLAEDADGTDDDVATASVTLSPTTIAGAVPITRRLMKQSSPAVEGMVMSDLARGAALAIDLAAIQGSGASNQPRGIVNQSGVLTQLVTGWATTPAPTWAQIVGFESQVDASDALDGQLGWITTPALVGTCKTTAKATNQAIFLMDSDRRSGVAPVAGSMNGYDVRRRSGLTAPTLIFGNFSDVLIGMWGVLDVMADTATKAKSGGLVLRVFQDVDVAVRHAESFCIGSAT